MFERRLSSQSNSSKKGLSTPTKIKPEPSDDSSSPNSPNVSRYGRSHKPKIQDGFVSTDKKVSAYLKLSPGNQLQCYSNKREYKKKNSPKKAKADSEETPRRGRPPKLQKKDSLESDSSLLKIKVEPQDPSSTVEGCEYMVGDLAWGRVGGHPFWPCIIALDPTQNIFTKNIRKGRTSVPQRWVHVQFFGDNGRRSWLNITSVMSYNGREAFVQLGDTILAGMRKKEPKQTAAFVIKPAVVQVWEKAVQEAEDLLNASREERVDFFSKYLPPPSVQLTKEEILDKLASEGSPPSPKKQRGRKRKIVHTPSEEESRQKQPKLDLVNVSNEESKVDKDETVDPLLPAPRTIADRKKRQALLMQMARNSQSPTVKSDCTPDPTADSSSPVTPVVKQEVQTPTSVKQAPLKSVMVIDDEDYMPFALEQTLHNSSHEKNLNERFQELVNEIFL